MTDRAAVVTGIILQTIKRVLLAWLDGDATSLAGARAAIENTLRDEFSDIQRQTVSEIRIRPEDE